MGAGPLVTSLIVINLPGVKLLSSRGSGANGRQHHHAKSRDVAEHRSGANLNVARVLGNIPGYRAEILRWTNNGLILTVRSYRFASQDPSAGLFPARRITLTRICPRRYFCDGVDNLRSLFKATLDGVADALGVNDKVFIDNPTESDVQSGKIGITYKQIDGPWGLRIEIEPAGGLASG